MNNRFTFFFPHMKIQFNALVRLSVCLLLLACSGRATAQDPRFSQFYHSPWNLNPAMSGLFNGSWRASVIYRDQWSSFLNPEPFRSSSASFDARLPVGRNDHVGFGLGVLHDEAGTARFVQNRVHLGGAYLRRLAGGRGRTSHYIGAGLQAGFGQNGIDWGRLWFSRQFDPNTETPDYSAGSGEPNANAASNMWLDLNAGVLWYTLFKNDGFVYAGAAMHHLNEPGISLIDDDSETLYRRYAVHAGAQVPLTNELALQPGVLWLSQGPAREINLGANIRYGNNDFQELALRAGAWLRMSNQLDKGLGPDALIITGMFEWERFMLGLSYDITVSSLSQANNSRGAFEISLSYIHPGGARKSRVECPSL